MAAPPQRPTDSPFERQGGVQNAHRDILAREVFGVDGWSNLASETQQTLSQLCDDAAYEIVNLAKWFHITDSSFDEISGSFADDLSEEFNELHRLMWTERAYRVFRSPQLAAEYNKATVMPAFYRAVDSFDPNFYFVSAGAWGDNISLDTMLRTVIGTLVRQRTPVIPPVEEGLRTIREEFVKLWESNRWPFRVRHTTLNIDGTDGSVTFGTEEEGFEGFDGFASKHIYILDSSGIVHKCEWLDSTRFSIAKAQCDASTNTSTGRPVYFFTEDRGSVQAIHWAPDPDDDYTAYANIIIKPPTFTSLTSNSSLNGLNSMPAAFRAHLRDTVIAKLLSKWGREDTDAKRLLAQIQMDSIQLADDWAERGAEAASVVPGAGFRMVNDLRSHRGSPVIGQWS